MATELHNLSLKDKKEIPNAKGLRVGIVVAQWNEEITQALVQGAVKTLQKHGVAYSDITVKEVPGSFELIYAAKKMALSCKHDAVIAFGSVIRGETPHFDYICQGVTYGIAHLNIISDVPVIYGLLTTNDILQARERSGGRLGNKGEECAIDAIIMAKL